MKASVDRADQMFMPGAVQAMQRGPAAASLGRHTEAQAKNSFAGVGLLLGPSARASGGDRGAFALHLNAQNSASAATINTSNLKNPHRSRKGKPLTDSVSMAGGSHRASHSLVVVEPTTKKGRIGADAARA
tara:strand:+ start:300 stop:692 length:393 start_codon:yes stop_codon:yes gene_type:complete